MRVAETHSFFQIREPLLRDGGSYRLINRGSFKKKKIEYFFWVGVLIILYVFYFVVMTFNLIPL